MMSQLFAMKKDRTRATMMCVPHLRLDVKRLGLSGLLFRPDCAHVHSTSRPAKSSRSSWYQCFYADSLGHVQDALRPAFQMARSNGSLLSNRSSGRRDLRATDQRLFSMNQSSTISTLTRFNVEAAASSDRIGPVSQHRAVA